MRLTAVSDQVAHLLDMAALTYVLLDRRAASERLPLCGQHRHPLGPTTRR